MPILEVKCVNVRVFFESSHVVAHKIKKVSLQSTQHSPFNSNTIKLYRLQIAACFMTPRQSTYKTHRRNLGKIIPLC